MGKTSKKPISQFMYKDNPDLIGTLRRKWGNDGAMFYTSLFIFLGRQPEQTCNYSSPNERAKLATEAWVDENLADEILNFFAETGIIDADLWNNNHVIWSEAFISASKSVFRSRRASIPEKPLKIHNDSKNPIQSTNEDNTPKFTDDFKIPENDNFSAIPKIISKKKLKNTKSTKGKKTTPEYSEAYENLYKIYPRHIGKFEGYKMYLSRIKDGWTHDQILKAIENYAKECKKNKTDEKYIKYLKTFLGESSSLYDYLESEIEESTSPNFNNSIECPFPDFDYLPNQNIN